MGMGEPQEKYSLEGNVLCIEGSLFNPYGTQIETYTAQLLEHDSDQLVLDLTGVEYMGSWYLGIIADLAAKANARSKRLKVMAADHVAKLISMSGLDRLVDLETLI